MFRTCKSCPLYMLRLCEKELKEEKHLSGLPRRTVGKDSVTLKGVKCSWASSPPKQSKMLRSVTTSYTSWSHKLPLLDKLHHTVAPLVSEVLVTALRFLVDKLESLTEVEPFPDSGTHHLPAVWKTRLRPPAQWLADSQTQRLLGLTWVNISLRNISCASARQRYRTCWSHLQRVCWMFQNLPHTGLWQKLNHC